MSTDKRDRWIKRLDQEKKAHKDWREQAECATKAYFAEQGNVKNAYPLFWPTVKVTHGRIYSQPPKPDVRKRYQDENAQKPAGGNMAGMESGDNEAGENAGAQGLPPAQASGAPAPGQNPVAGNQPQPVSAPTVDDNKLAQCIERGLGYVIDTTEFDADGHMAVNDLLVAALGIAKVEMDTETEKRPVVNPATGQPIMLDMESGQPFNPMVHTGEPIPALSEVIVDQTLRLRHFSHSQFRWEPQQHWSQVSWVGFDHWMTADEIREQFKKDVATGSDREDGGADSTSKPDANKYKHLFCVTEIWNKKDKTRLFVTDAYADLLGEDEDPLGLKGFFPCPKPMLLNVRGDDLVPTPDYAYCEEMFKYCSRLTVRINKLTDQIKDIGFYDAGFPELAQLTSQMDGNLIPIANLSARLEKLGNLGKGYDAVVAKQDNTGKVAVLQQLVQLRDLQKQAIWEIYGISDIQRGSTDPNETATAQNIKAEWANVRVGERIRIVALFFRDVFRLMAEIMAEKFQPDILEKMTGIELNEAEIEILHSDYGRCYAIDVESDSTVVQDESAEKAQRLEFLNTVSQFIQQLLPAITQNVIPADMGKELLLFAVNTFKNGRQLEQSINNLPGTMQQLSQLSTTNQQAQAQIQQLTKQLQDLQAQLQKINQGKEQRDNVKVSADAEKTAAETTRTQLESANLAQDIRGKVMEPVPHGEVVPMRKPFP